MNIPLFLIGCSVIVVGFYIALRLRKWHFGPKKTRAKQSKLSHSEPRERDLASEDSEGDGVITDDPMFPPEDDSDDA